MLKNLAKALAAVLIVIAASACEPLPPSVRNLVVTGDGSPSSVEIVNSATYSYLDEAPAIDAYRRVARFRGWPEAVIDRWQPFVSAVIRRESGYCYNLRRGATLANATNCVIARQGRGSDSGFGQLISIHYKPGAWLCTQEGLCSADDIIDTPWDSMTALVALLERGGRQPWCYTARLRAGSSCRLAPQGLPL